MQATEAENRMLRSRLSCLEELLLGHSVSVDQPSDDSSDQNYSPADAPAAASSGAGASAGVPEQIAFQVRDPPLL